MPDELTAPEPLEQLVKAVRVIQADWWHVVVTEAKIVGPVLPNVRKVGPAKFVLGGSQRRRTIEHPKTVMRSSRHAAIEFPIPEKDQENLPRKSESPRLTPDVDYPTLRRKLHAKHLIAMVGGLRLPQKTRPGKNGPAQRYNGGLGDFLILVVLLHQILPISSKQLLQRFAKTPVPPAEIFSTNSFRNRFKDSPKKPGITRRR